MNLIIIYCMSIIYRVFIIIKTVILIFMKRSNYDDMPVFGKKMMMLRKAHNMRQEDLAKELGTSRVQISYYESRAKNPTMEFIQKVAIFFKVSTDQLLKEDIDASLKPGPESKLERQLELIRRLPSNKQKVISQMLEMILKGELLESK